MLEIVKVNRNGTLSIPRVICRDLGLENKEKLVLVTDQDSILLKRIGQVQARKRILELTENFHLHFKKAKIKDQDVKKEISLVRLSKR